MIMNKVDLSVVMVSHNHSKYLSKILNQLSEIR